MRCCVSSCTENIAGSGMYAGWGCLRRMSSPWGAFMSFFQYDAEPRIPVWDRWLFGTARSHVATTLLPMRQASYGFRVGYEQSSFGPTHAGVQQFGRMRVL